MNRKRLIALLLCIALLLSLPVSAAYDNTARINRASLCVPPAVQAQTLGVPSFSDDAPLRLVSYQWYAGSMENAVSAGSAVTEAKYFLTVTARLRDAAKDHVDDLSYISTDGAATQLSRTVDDRAGAITATFAVPVLKAGVAAITLPECAAGENIADVLYEAAVDGGSVQTEMTTLLVYDGENHVGTGVKNSDNFFVFTDAQATFLPTHTYTVIGTALFADACFTGDAITSNAAPSDTLTVLGDARTVGFCWRFTVPVRTEPKPFPFTDVAAERWYYSAIDYCFQHDLMNGVAANRFDPSAPFTRAMLVTTLYRLAGAQTPNAAAGFTDVPDGKWYTPAVRWAREQKLVEGYGSGRFGPDDPITREQLATIIERYVNYMKLRADRRADLSAFPDAGRVSTYAFDAMRWAVAEGLLQGKLVSGTNYLAPRDHATRAECATILMRLCELIAREA